VTSLRHVFAIHCTTLFCHFLTEPTTCSSSFPDAWHIFQYRFIFLVLLWYAVYKLSYLKLGYYHQHHLITAFSLVRLLLSHWWTPPFRLQVSDCSTFLMMCDVPSTADFCRESVECSGIVSRFFKTFTYNSRGPNGYRYDKACCVPRSLNFCT
jgi:hypothetical protein